MLLNGTVFEFDRINELLNHLEFSLCCMLIQKFVGQLLERGLLNVIAKEWTIIFRVTYLD